MTCIEFFPVTAVSQTGQTTQQERPGCAIQQGESLIGDGFRMMSEQMFDFDGAHSFPIGKMGVELRAFQDQPEEIV